MDGRDLSHEFSKVKHGVAKRLTREPKRKFWSVYLPSFALTVVAVPVVLLMDKSPDDLTTTQTEQVQQQFQQQLQSMTAETPQEAQRDFIANLLLAEDLSEKQAEDFLKDFKNNIGNPETALGHEIGDIGDLRESRAANPGDVEAIAKATVDAETPENIVRGFDAVFTLVFMFWLIGRGTNALMRKSDTLQDWAKEKPRNPKFKH